MIEIKIYNVYTIFFYHSRKKNIPVKKMISGIKSNVQILMKINNCGTVGN